MVLSRRCSILAMFFAAVLATGSTALADRGQAKQYYDEAEKRYNLGKFDEAITLYTKAYEEWPDAVFLFNIAQAFRQAGNCARSMFFYKRFLSLKKNDTKKPLEPALREEVEGRIRELEECTKIPAQPPRDNMPPEIEDGRNGKPGGAEGPGGKKPKDTKVAAGEEDAAVEDDGEDGGDVDLWTGGLGNPKYISMRLSAGASKLVLDKQVPVPVQFATALTVGYPLTVHERVILDLGGGFSFMPIPYDKFPPEGGSGTAKMMSLFGNVGVITELAPKFAIRTDVGAGVLMWSGLEMSNPFTEGAAKANGALTMFNLRLGLAAEYSFTRHLIGSITPIVFSYSPAKDGLRPEISSLKRFDFLVGLGYQM